MISIRQLTWEDADRADEILTAAFRFPHSRKRDMGRYLRLTPNGWLLGLVDGEPAGTVGAVIYPEYAYIGLMAVHPRFQGRGLGQALLTALLSLLEEKGVPMSLLDASTAGHSLYLKNGFVAEDVTRYFERAGQQPPASPPSAPARTRLRPITPADLPAISVYDRPLFGADRTAVFDLFLNELPRRAFLLENERPAPGESPIEGFVFAQEQRIGPWMANSDAAAAPLLAAALELDFEAPPVVLISGLNPGGVTLLAQSGFTLNRSLPHMRTGGAGLTSRRQHMYGQASFALG